MTDCKSQISWLPKGFVIVKYLAWPDGFALITSWKLSPSCVVQSGIKFAQEGGVKCILRQRLSLQRLFLTFKVCGVLWRGGYIMEVSVRISMWLLIICDKLIDEWLDVVFVLYSLLSPPKLRHEPNLKLAWLAAHKRDWQINARPSFTIFNLQSDRFWQLIECILSNELSEDLDK